MSEFKAWPKTPRLFRDITITEKIDGTNAAVQIHKLEGEVYGDKLMVAEVEQEDGVYGVWAQSRKRLITPQDDNAGFARWVSNQAHHLVPALGPGTHYGEWWGQGIQRNYGMNHKRFSLFNTSKWNDLFYLAEDHHWAHLRVAGIDVVPVMYEGPFSETAVKLALADLRMNGSIANPDYDNPEGVIVYHHAANSVFKVLLENDEIPKGLVSTSVA